MQLIDDFIGFLKMEYGAGAVVKLALDSFDFLTDTLSNSVLLGNIGG